MKTREDFVSNSSSSSFVLFGIEFEIEDFIKQLKNSPFKKVRDLVKSDDEEDEDNDGIYDIIDELVEHCNEYVIDNDSGILVIGKPPDQMKDDETLKDFKQRVVNMVKLMGIDKNVSDVKYITGIDADGCISFDD